MQRLERKIAHEKILFASLPQLSLDIVNLVKSRGRIALSEAAVLTGANPNTVKKHLQNLVKSGLLVRHGAGRGVWYALP
jgi:predicted ArsR family transcriptional regulator